MTNEKILELYNDSFKFSEIKNKQVLLSWKPFGKIYFVEVAKEKMDVYQIEENIVAKFSFDCPAKRTFWDKLFNRPQKLAVGNEILKKLPLNSPQNDFYVAMYHELQAHFNLLGITEWIFAIRGVHTLVINAFIKETPINLELLNGAANIEQMPIIGKRTIRYPSDIKNFCTKHAILLKDLYVTYDGQTKKLVLDNE